ncbi:hypothetical protein AKH00_12305 [Microbacterium sp. GCS4]|nr:hypothetical protein AKH00_12305 [Microbacterium sp. GCS4]
MIELKVFGQGFFKNNIGNRASELLATAVEMRRLFRGEILLTAVLILKLTPATSPIHESTWPRLADRLLRADDGVGYDSVLFGFADSQLSWRYFAPRGGRQEMKESPRTTSEAIAMIRQEAVSPDTSRPTARRPIRRFLLVSDEWRSGRGGISTINRHLAIALAAAGHEATVLVPRVTEEDARVASAANVSIVAPPRIPGLSEKETLLLRPIFGEKGWEPDVIIGHGRALGPYAAAQQRQFFPGARRVHLVHTDAESLEAAKEEHGGTSTMTITESRRNLEIDLARSADLVAGIGPLLTETIRDDLLGPGAPATVMEFMPGLRDLFDASTTRAPVKNRVLFIGRADDFHSKGIDLAAEALLKIMDEWPRGRSHPPVLVIRGVPDDAADDVKRKLDSIFDGRVSYTLRPYTDSETVLTHDLAQAKVLIMPSRHEGFGLAAFEAISAGVPVLISAESGVAQFLSESHLDTSPRSVISTRDSPTRLAVDRWADAIQAVLDDFDSARSEVTSLRTSVGRLVSWNSVTERLVATLQGLP